MFSFVKQTEEAAIIKMPMGESKSKNYKIYMETGIRNKILNVINSYVNKNLKHLILIKVVLNCTFIRAYNMEYIAVQKMFCFLVQMYKKQGTHTLCQAKRGPNSL